MPLKVVRIFRRRVVPSAKDTLSAAIPVLKTVKAAADIANAPLVGNIASVLLVCVETAKDARSNKEDALELLARIVQLVLPTINRIHAMGFPSTPAAENLLHDMKELLPMFEQVSSAMSNITRRNLFFRFMRSVADKEKILEQRRQLDNRLQDFSYNSLVSLRMASAVAESQDYATLQQEDVELLEVEGTHKSPDDDEFRYSNIYRARLRADGTTVLLLQCKRDIAAMNFLAEVHRYHDAYHPNVVQFRGASSQTSRPRFVVVDDHPYFACAVLAPENPYGLSVRERVRLALRMVADMYSFFEYLDHNDMPTPRRVTRGYFVTMFIHLASRFLTLTASQV
ncbi:hypothetical protein PLICRDRAFT_438690 [Plicaturopsis crispa FD-325 SS-3]|uniref:RPW8 domain-containing protein n=1 Tax=Plicaturopsis crispa FD-325 SS-3 TaxID=944288 RepID=A0A0C9SKG9_PLICR|nr:hypothetical protein PLICRDRAFT_438690 [Plicaturopsis crispa FD-325 SS-3]